MTQLEPQLEQDPQPAVEEPEPTPYFQHNQQLPPTMINPRELQLLPKITEREREYYQKLDQEHTMGDDGLFRQLIHPSNNSGSYSSEYSPINPSYKGKAADLIQPNHY